MSHPFGRPADLILDLKKNVAMLRFIAFEYIFTYIRPLPLFYVALCCMIFKLDDKASLEYILNIGISSAVAAPE